MIIKYNNFYIYIMRINNKIYLYNGINIITDF